MSGRGNSNNGVPTFEEVLEIERDRSVPDSALPSSSSLARRIMFRGEWFVVKDVAAELGKPNKKGQALVWQAMSVMKQLGFHFEKRQSPDGGRGAPTEIRLRNPAYRPSKATLDAYREASSNGRAAYKAQRNFTPRDQSAAAEERRRKDRARKRRNRARKLGLPEPPPEEYVEPKDVEVVRPDSGLPQVDERSLVAQLARGVDPFRR